MAFFIKCEVFGVGYDLFALSSLPKSIDEYIDARDSAAYTVFLLPSSAGDIDCEVYDHRGKNAGISLGAAVAAALFLVKFRGLPLESVDVMNCGKLTEVSFSPDFSEVFVTIPKCKLNISKTHVFPDMTDVNVKIVSQKLREKAVAVAECDDCELFSDDKLCELLLSFPGADISCAYSYREGELSVKIFAPVQSCDARITAAAAAAFLTGERLGIYTDIDSARVKLTPCCGGISAGFKTPPLYRFETPFL